MVADLADLVEMEFSDPEMVPEILPVDARLSIKAPVAGLLALFTRASAVAVASQDKEMLAGTSNVLLEAVQAQKKTVAFLRGTASDGEKTVSILMDDVTVLREGAVLLPAHRLREILKLAPAEYAKIEIVGNTATIQCGQALWTVQIVPGDALSVHLATDGVRSVPVKSKGFSEALSAVRRAAADSDARHSLMQIQLRNGAFTACDGGRVHRMTMEGLDPSLDVAIPIGAADEILKAIRGSSETTATFGYDERHIVFEIGNDRIVSQILLVEFPQSVENLLLGPAFSNSRTLRVNRRELIETVRRVRINANPESAAITLGLTPARRDGDEVDWNLSVRARDQAKNSSQETLECSWTGGGAIPELMLNHHYLMDLLEVYPSDEVFFKVGEDSKSTRTPLLIEDLELGFTGIVQQMFSVR